MIKCPISIKCYKVKQNNLEMVKKKKKQTWRVNYQQSLLFYGGYL